MLLVPQQGRLCIATELGVLDVQPGDVALPPRGLAFRIALPDADQGPARGYVAGRWRPGRHRLHGRAGDDLDGWKNPLAHHALDDPCARHHDAAGPEAGRVDAGAVGGRPAAVDAAQNHYAILRDILREVRQYGDAADSLREFRILAAQPVVDLCLEEEAQSLTMLSDFIGKPISMQVESVYHQEQYDIVLV